MPLTIRCPHCQKTLVVPLELAGRKGRCPDCRQSFPIVASQVKNVPVLEHKPAAIADQRSLVADIVDAETRGNGQLAATTSAPSGQETATKWSPISEKSGRPNKAKQGTKTDACEPMQQGSGFDSAGPLPPTADALSTRFVSATLQFLCPQGHLLETQTSQMGQQSQCPMCGMVFGIPVMQGQAPSVTANGPGGNGQLVAVPPFPGPIPGGMGYQGQMPGVAGDPPGVGPPPVPQLPPPFPPTNTMPPPMVGTLAAHTEKPSARASVAPPLTTQEGPLSNWLINVLAGALVIALLLIFGSLASGDLAPGQPQPQIQPGQVRRLQIPPGLAKGAWALLVFAFVCIRGLLKFANRHLLSSGISPPPPTGRASSGHQWWVSVAGQVSGPFPTASVLSGARAGQFVADTNVCEVGGSAWMPLADWLKG